MATFNPILFSTFHDETVTNDDKVPEVEQEDVSEDTGLESI